MFLKKLWNFRFPARPLIGNFMEFRKFQEPEKIKVELRNPSAGARRKFQISRVRPYARPLVRPIVRPSSLPVAVTLPVVALRLASPVRPRCGLM